MLYRIAEMLWSPRVRSIFFPTFPGLISGKALRWKKKDWKGKQQIFWLAALYPGFFPANAVYVCWLIFLRYFCGNHPSPSVLLWALSCSGAETAVAAAKRSGQDSLSAAIVGLTNPPTHTYSVGNANSKKYFSYNNHDFEKISMRLTNTL